MSEGPACDATCRAIRDRQLEQAVDSEFLEGRSVFWSQAFCLWTPLDKLDAVASAPSLATELWEVPRKLEDWSQRITSRQVNDVIENVLTPEREAATFQVLDGQ